MQVPESIATAPPEALLRWAISTFGRSLAVCTSFQSEGMVILDMAARIDSGVRVVTLDTGRMPEETHQMVEEVRKRYGLKVETVLPDAGEVEGMVTRFGPNLFYQDPSLRNLCCQVRKVLPLERKLKEFRAWVAGLRRTQTAERAGLQKVELLDGRLKLSPLADWSTEQVERYIAEHEVPRHPLYARGYTSIGCGPCTRATLPGESERAGRWWWEMETPKECGLHFSGNGVVRRTVDVLLEQLRQRPSPAEETPAELQAHLG